MPSLHWLARAHTGWSSQSTKDLPGNAEQVRACVVQHVPADRGASIANGSCEHCLSCHASFFLGFRVYSGKSLEAKNNYLRIAPPIRTVFAPGSRLRSQSFLGFPRVLGIRGLGSLIGAEEVSHSASHSWHGFMCLVASIP